MQSGCEQHLIKLLPRWELKYLIHPMTYVIPVCAWEANISCQAMPACGYLSTERLRDVVLGCTAKPFYGRLEGILCLSDVMKALGHLAADGFLGPDVAVMQYGKQDVPLSAEQEGVLRFNPEKGLWLLGFLEAAKVPRHHFLKVCSASECPWEYSGRLSTSLGPHAARQ